MKAEFFSKKLASGLKVLFEKRKLPVVSVSASVNYGSGFESIEKKGISHLIEHMTFKGTKTRSHEEIAREIEKKGGILNAFTGEEVTSYWNKMPSKHLASGISIASDLILNPKFDALEFEKEKKVILEEIKMYHDNPRLYVMDKIKELLYKKPFGMSGTGTAKSVKGIKKEEILSLFNSVYSSDAMILAVVGEAEFDEICEIAEKVFPSGKRKIVDYVLEKINKEEIEKRKHLEQAHFIFGFHAPRMQDKEKYAYEIAGAHLFGGMSSRLFEEIREKRNLAYSVAGNFELGKNYGYCSIYAGTLKEKIKEVKEIILKEIKNLKDLKQRDFEECKEQLIGNRKVASEDSTDAMNMLVFEEISGKAEEYYKYEERINAVKLDEVKNIKLKNFSSFSLVPG